MEKFVLMQIEDNMVVFEKEDGNTIIYSRKFVPITYKLGDVIKAVVDDEYYIEFLVLDTEEMEKRKSKVSKLKSRLRNRSI